MDIKGDSDGLMKMEVRNMLLETGGKSLLQNGREIGWTVI